MIVAEDVVSGATEAIERGDLVCLGLSGRSDLRRDRSGSIAERIHDRLDCSIAIARGPPAEQTDED